MSTRKKKRRNNLIYCLEIVLCLIALTAVIAALYLGMQYHSVKEENEKLSTELANYDDPENPYYSKSEVDAMLEKEYADGLKEGLLKGEEGVEQDVLSDIKKTLTENNSPLETIKLLYPDDIIVVNDGQYLFFPIDKTLKLHAYEDDSFTKEDDKRITYQDSEYSAVTGIDVSRFQEKINWKKVAGDGIDYAIIRLGYRGYTKGDIMMDDTFEDNINGALDNKLDVGVYFLTQATSNAEAKEEAQYVLDAIEPYNVTYPVVLDVELVGGDSGRGNKLSMSERTEYAKTFLDTIENAGYDTMIYGNLKTFMLMLDMKELEDCSKWYASYGDIPYFPYAIDMWQYTDTGSVSGISGDVDINIQFIKK